jgi:hypothetical protein
VLADILRLREVGDTLEGIQNLGGERSGSAERKSQAMYVDGVQLRKLPQHVCSRGEEMLGGHFHAANRIRLGKDPVREARPVSEANARSLKRMS